MVAFHSLPLSCGPSPGEDPFVFGSNLLCFFASATHLATGFRSAVFPLPTSPQNGNFFYIFIFSLAPFYFCARYLRLFGGDTTYS